MEGVWLVGILCALVGAGVGFLVAVLLSPQGRKTRTLESELQQVRQRLKDYQLEANAHFTETARLLNSLADSYRDIHNHLADGARALCDVQDPSALPRKLPETFQHDNGVPPVDESVRPPLDYAPRTAYHEGTLREDYGLEKPAPEPSDDADEPAAPAFSRET